MLSTLKLYAEKFAKSELWVTLAAMMASALSKKLGIPDEAITEFILSTTGLAVAFIGGRSYSKPRELDASARALSLKVEPFKAQ